ncbi:MAG: cyclic nucleotide-binding domain-containing protein [Acidobacteria bacterium]|jgi:AAA family ATP:ADP antiporter|nr:cyclic nucleotide-binding domain-containing protein [Acidobacteriota bacterium]
MVPPNRIVAWLHRTFALRRGEGRRALLLTLYLGVVIASYLILKAVRDALFISAFSAMKLPYVIFGIALLVGIFVDGYIRLSRRVSAARLTTWTLAFFISNLVLFWFLARMGLRWLYPVLYIWVGFFGIAAPVQVWTLANEVFTTREAKRVFGLVGGGGIAGAIVGGALASVLALKVGTEQLLLVVAGLLVVAIVLVRLIASYRLPVLRTRRDEVLPWSLAVSAQKIAASPHLKVLASLVFVGALATTIVDFQFKAAAAGAGFDRDELTAFFAAALSAMSAIGLVVQLGVVRPVLRSLGLGAAILVLPLSLLAGETTLIVAGGLWAAVFMKASDGAFKHSIDRSSKELAYLPVPMEIKVQVKSAIDMVLDRLGDATGGLVLLVLATWLNLSIGAIGWVNLVLLALWLLLARRLRQSYIDELATSLGAKSARASYELDASLIDADARAGVRRALAAADPQTIGIALEMAALAPGPDLEPELAALARHESPEVRARVLGVFLAPGASGMPPELLDRLEEADQDLLAKGLDLVLAQTPEERRERALALIGNKTPDTQGVMLALLVRRLGPEFTPVAAHVLTGMLAADAPAPLRRAATRAIGLLPFDSALAGQLDALLDDPDPEVRSDAAESAGRLGRADLAPLLVAMLGSHRTRPAAHRALVALGAEAIEPLRTALEAPPDGTRAVRRAAVAALQHVPPVLRALGSSGAIALLVEHLGHPDENVREAAIHAIERLRQRDPENLLAGPELVDPQIAADGERHARALAAFGAVAAEPGPAAGFLAARLRDELERTRRRVLSLLRLRLGPKAAQAVARGLESGRKDLRDNALELLDSALPRPLRAAVVPMLEDEPAHVIEMRHGEPIGYPSPRRGEALRELALGADPWTAAAALRVAAAHSLPWAEAAASRRWDHDDEVLREEARRIVRRDGAGEGDRRVTMSLLDRAVALRGVDAFRGVTTDQLALIAAIAHERVLPDGSLLFDEGAPPDSLFVVLDGSVALSRGGAPMGTVGGGEALGTWSLLDDEPRSARALAAGPVRVLAIDREDFFDVLAEHSEISRSLMRDLVGRLRTLAG